MKNLTLPKLIGILLICCTLCSCQKKADDTPSDFPSLIGKWKLTYTVIDATELNGQPFYFLDTLGNGSPVYWEFFDNGIMKATEDNTTVESNWELKVERLTPNGLGIDKGQLILTGSYADQVKTALELDALVYSIETSTETKGMNLAVKPKNLSNTFSTVTITYSYQKI